MNKLGVEFISAYEKFTIQGTMKRRRGLRGEKGEEKRKKGTIMGINCGRA